MKKLLLSLICLATVATMASAATATFSFTGETAYGMALLSGSTSEYNANPFVCNEGDVTLTLNGSTRWWNANKGPELRFYTGSSMQLAVPEGQTITKIELTASAPANFEAAGYDNGVWNGNAQSVSIACTITKGNTPITAITVTYGEGEGGGDTPSVSNYGLYAPVSTVADGVYVLYASEKIATPLAADKQYGYLPAVDAALSEGTVKALKDNQFTITAVDGGYTIQDPSGRYYYQTGTYNSFNVSAERTDGDIWSITISDGTAEIKNVNVEKWIQFDPNYTSWGSYPDQRGVNPALCIYTTDATGGDEPEQPEEPEIPSIDGLNPIYDCDNNTQFKMDTDLTVIYSNGAYTYVTDGIVNGLIYKYDMGVVAGNVIAKGWTGKVSIFKNLVEMVPDSAPLPLVEGAVGTVPAPLDVEADDVSIFVAAYNQSAYLNLKNVVFADETPASGSFTGTMGDATVTFYQRFGLESVAAGTYDVEGFVAVYGDQVQIYPTKITSTSGISSIVANDAQARYYNINGVEVSNPTAGGVYIRVAGGKATKVIK